MTKTSQIKQLITNLDSADIIALPKSLKKPDLEQHLVELGVPLKYVFKLRQCSDTSDPLECLLNAHTRATILRFITKHLRFKSDHIKAAYAEEVRQTMQDAGEQG